MATDILISLEPRHADNVLSGSKTVELRRRPIRVPSGTGVWIYSKIPKACIEGRVVVDRVCEAPVDQIWEEFGDQTGVSKEEFDTYMKGVQVGCALVLRSATRLDSAINLKELRTRVKRFHPPQFYKRLSPTSVELAVLSRWLHSDAETGQRFRTGPVCSSEALR